MPTSGQSEGMNVRGESNLLEFSLPTPTVLGTAEAAILTAPAGGRYIADSIVLCDSSGIGSTVTIRKYASALGNVATANLFTTVTIGANETVIVDFGQKGLYLTNGQILAALAGNAARINMDVNYRKER